jgi:hypothetical protein
MVAEWLTLAQGITSIGSKIFGDLSKYSHLKAEQRKKIADLLDDIAKDVLSVSKQMNKKEIPVRSCAAILEYSRQLPPLLERVYDKAIATQLGDELAAVYNSKQLAALIFQDPGRANDLEAELRALTSTIDAAAGTITASANILRAL